MDSETGMVLMKKPDSRIPRLGGTIVKNDNLDPTKYNNGNYLFNTPREVMFSSKPLW